MSGFSNPCFPWVTHEVLYHIVQDRIVVICDHRGSCWFPVYHYEASYELPPLLEDTQPTIFPCIPGNERWNQHTDETTSNNITIVEGECIFGVFFLNEHGLFVLYFGNELIVCPFHLFSFLRRLAHIDWGGSIHLRFILRTWNDSWVADWHLALQCRHSVRLWLIKVLARSYGSQS